MQDNTLLWILGIGIAGYFAYEYYESSQSTAETITPATSTVTSGDTSSTPSQVTTPTQQSGQIATASNVPIAHNQYRANMNMNINQAHFGRRR